ncbi:MAG: hypothetical protein OXB88_01800 [Bacteriovoracales bacterium]|nr:hypothetical protein [Bacteriovoracales bacterium]
MKGLIFSMLLVTSPVFAETQEQGDGSRNHHEGAKCLDSIDANDAQRAAAKKVFMGAKKSIGLHKDVVHSLYRNFRQTLVDPQGAKYEAKAAFEDLVEGIVALKQIKMEAKLEVLFGILDVEQRIAMVACKAEKYKHKFGGHHHGGHHHGGHGHGHGGHGRNHDKSAATKSLVKRSYMDVL